MVTEDSKIVSVSDEIYNTVYQFSKHVWKPYKNTTPLVYQYTQYTTLPLEQPAEQRDASLVVKQR